MLCFWTSLFVPVFAKGVSYISKQPFPKKLGSHFSGCRTSLSTFYCICVHVLCVIVFVSEFLCVWICVWIQVIWRSKAFHSFPVIKMGFASRWFTLCRLHWPLVVVLDFALNCRCQAPNPTSLQHLFKPASLQIRSLSTPSPFTLQNWIFV